MSDIGAQPEQGDSEVTVFRCSHSGCPAHTQRIARKDRLREVEAASRRLLACWDGALNDQAMDDAADKLRAALEL